jgi:hypothetical protein
MRFSKFFFLPLVTVACGLFASSVSAAVVTFVSPKNAANGSSSIQSGTDYTTNLGYAFKTGPSGPFDIDWVTMSLTSGSVGASVSFKISIHGTNNDTPYAAIPDATVYASDTVTVTTPGTANTPFDKTFTAADIPNITNYRLESNKAYSIFVNSAAGGGIALRRRQGLAENTANDEYNVTSGFTMLDTFRNNSPNYRTNSTDPNTQVTFAISFGGTASASGAVPEPTTMALWTLLFGGGLVRSYRNKASRR